MLNNRKTKERLKESKTNTGYQLRDLDELMEYFWLRPADSGLDVDIFVDDGGAYIRHGHALQLFVRNGYSGTDEDFIPVSVGARPRAFRQGHELKIGYDDLFAVGRFIQRNLKLLMDLPNDRISHIEFLRGIRANRDMMKEECSLLMEMATLKAKDSGLPTDIWIDEGGRTLQHAPRIKFRASKEQTSTWEYSTMIISDNPTIENYPKKGYLRTKDIERLKTFVRENQSLLIQLAKNEISYETFLLNIKKA